MILSELTIAILVSFFYLFFILNLTTQPPLKCSHRYINFHTRHNVSFHILANSNNPTDHPTSHKMQPSLYNTFLHMKSLSLFSTPKNPHLMLSFFSFSKYIYFHDPVTYHIVCLACVIFLLPLKLTILLTNYSVLNEDISAYQSTFTVHFITMLHGNKKGVP